MNKKIFFKNKKKLISFFFLLITFSIIIYFISYNFYINKPYFTIKKLNQKYFIIPVDKEGEKINFIDKKSINNKHNTNSNKKIELNNITDVEYSIQLYSSDNYINILEFKSDFVKLKSELIDENDLYLFSVETDIGIDYFLSYKNFITKNNALKYCNEAVYLNKCLILHLDNE